MPIFDYRCEACGHSVDILQKLGADALEDCPECGKATLKKLLSAPAFHLKGKGWRNSDDAPKKMDVRPKFAHTLDSPVAHAEHSHDGPSEHKHDHSTDSAQGHSHSHGSEHKHEPQGGMEKLVRKHVDKDIDKKSHKSHGHSHDHGHSHGHGHKHDK